jgi:tetratricopeptide (TPR) repeat protein
MSELSELQKLQGNIAWAIRNDLDASELIPMFERLLACAPHGSKLAQLARLHLAELFVEPEPWKAALLAKSLLKEVDDERAWAVLGLAHTLLGHHHCARKAYWRALSLSPNCPSYAHNLGHLIDVVFNDPQEALSLLATAYRGAPGEVEVAASYAHALVRCNRWSDARRVLSRALGAGAGDAVDQTLNDWLRSCPPPQPGSRRLGALQPRSPRARNVARPRH